MEAKTSLESFFEKTEEYLETWVDLFKLNAVNKYSEVLSSLTTSLFFIFMTILAVLMLSIGIALLIGETLGKTYYGFFVVGGLYIVAGLVFFIFRRLWLKEPVSNHIIRKVLN